MLGHNNILFDEDLLHHSQEARSTINFIEAPAVKRESHIFDRHGLLCSYCLILKMGQTRPLFVYFCSFHNTMTNMAQI